MGTVLGTLPKNLKSETGYLMEGVPVLGWVMIGDCLLCPSFFFDDFPKKLKLIIEYTSGWYGVQEDFGGGE